MAHDKTSPEQPRVASKPPSESPIFGNEPTKVSGNTQLKDISAEEIARAAASPSGAPMAHPDLCRAMDISLGLPPTAEQLAADPDLPRLQRKWKDTLKDIRTDFKLRDRKQDLTDPMISATGLYWTDRSQRQKEEMGTGEREKVNELESSVRKVLSLLSDQKLRNRLHLAEQSITPEQWDRLSVDDKGAAASKSYLDGGRAQLAEPASLTNEFVVHVGDVVSPSSATLKGDSTGDAQRALCSLLALVPAARKIKAIKPKGHHTALRNATKPLAIFSQKLGRSISLTSGRTPSRFVCFMAECLTLIVYMRDPEFGLESAPEITADVARRACLSHK